MISLGSADSYSVLAATTITSTGLTQISGSLGVFPGMAIVGFPPATLQGQAHHNDEQAQQAQNDALLAYTAITQQTPEHDLTGQELGGKVLTPGVYAFSSSAECTGVLVLDAKNKPGALFVFQIGSTLTTAKGAAVVLINGAQERNVFWQVASSATLGAGTTFCGSLLAYMSITATTDALVRGGLYALRGAVTLDTNRVHR